MSSLERLREYANPRRKENWDGQSSDKANIDRWSRRATENSDGHRHRAKSGEIELPSTGSPPSSFHPRAGSQSGVGKLEAAHHQAKVERNHLGSKYMSRVRRVSE
jgi:hypothetical protein